MTTGINNYILHKHMASGINIYSFFRISRMLIMDIRKRISDTRKCILDIRLYYTLLIFRYPK